MSGLPRRLRTMTRNRIRRFGGGLQVTLRRESTLSDRRTGQPARALVLVATAALGATALSLSGGAAQLKGVLISGAALSIAGESYTTAAAATAGANGLLAVTLASGLLAEAAAGVAVTVTAASLDEVYDAMQGEEAQEDAAGAVDGTVRRLHLAAGEGLRAPERDDLVVAGLAQRERVVRVQPVSPGSTPVRWTVITTTKKGTL